MKIIEHPSWRGKQKSHNAGTLALKALLEAAQPEDVAEDLIQEIERRHRRGTPGFFRAVGQTARRCSPELRAAVFAVLVTR